MAVAGLRQSHLSDLALDLNSEHSKLRADTLQQEPVYNKMVPFFLCILAMIVVLIAASSCTSGMCCTFKSALDMVS